MFITRVFTILLTIIVTTTTCMAISCNVSDDEAIILANNFVRKLGISFSEKPLVEKTDAMTDALQRYQNNITKEVIYGERSDYTGIVKINCNNKDIVLFSDSEVPNRVRLKYNIPSNNLLPRKWPPFLSEKKATEKILSYAKKIGIPSDFKFEEILDINKRDAEIRGRWNRSYNGFPYESDSIHISIMAVDGELYSFHKSYYGKPCPTDVKVTMEEATNEGWKQIEKLYNSTDWKQLKSSYDVTGKLKIVQPNVLAGQMYGRRSPESRLAWVLHYRSKTRSAPKKNEVDSSIRSIMIKIDAGTMKFLGGDRSK